jgi:gluconokinase
VKKLLKPLWLKPEVVNPQIVLVMGVSGSGKSTIGKALADDLKWSFADADDYHSVINHEKMARGEPLSDTDRLPWLEQLHQLILEHACNRLSLVLACSALKQSYRKILIGNLSNVTLVFLQGDWQIIAKRMLQRQHFMPVSQLENQFQMLEPPQNAIIIDIQQPIKTIVFELRQRLRKKL